MSVARLAGPWTAAILVLVGTVTTATAQSSQPDPSAVLKKAGLQRSGHSFVLDSELDANKLEQSIGQLQNKVGQALAKQQEAQMMRNEAQQLRNQANSVRGFGRLPRGARAAGNNQANTLNNQAQQLEQRARQRMSPADAAALTKDSKQLNDDQDRYRNLVAKTQKSYKDLSKQEDVVQALRKLNRLAHPKAALGPIPQYAENVARQCSDELIDMGLARDKDLFHLADDDKLAEAIAAVALKRHKAEKAGAAAPDLSREVADLRTRADEAKARRDQLAEDEVVKDLLDELQKVPKSKVRLGVSLKLQRALNDLKSIEKDLGEAQP